MRSPRGITLWLAGLTLAAGLPAQEALERLGERLNFGFANGALRVRLSGSFELEAHSSSETTADLVSGGDDTLLNPRFTLYLDAQAGTRGYIFAQGRVDRGFDVYAPQEKTEARFDEYALRVELSEPGTGRLFAQAGKFATAVGNWTKRHAAWDNPFITAPLPYDNLTAMWDVAPPPSTEVLLAWAHVRPAGAAEAVLADKRQRLPVIWGPAYGQGMALAGQWGRFDYTAELKSVGLSSRPERWDERFGDTERPTASVRLGWQPNPMWILGLSASRGEYLDRTTHPRIPVGFTRHDYRETLVAHDLSFAWRHFQLWAEVMAARFETPRLGSFDTLAWYTEAKYRFTPRFSAAMRWGQQHFDRVATTTGDRVQWGRQTWRFEVAPAWRFTAQMQFKLQFGLHHEAPAQEDVVQSIAGQFNVRF